ncbi:Uncharacterised protein [Vibrio cholerae]|nr:Uncharacterised protein [Vibrio cholerae]
MTGRIKILRVNAPERIEKPKPKIATKKVIPNRPKMIEGIPASDSVQKRMILTKRLPTLAYSVK